MAICIAESTFRLPAVSFCNKGPDIIIVEVCPRQKRPIFPSNNPILTSFRALSACPVEYTLFGAHSRNLLHCSFEVVPIIQTGAGNSQGIIVAPVSRDAVTTARGLQRIGVIESEK